MIKRLPRIVSAYLAASAGAGFALALGIVLWTLIEPLLYAGPRLDDSGAPSSAYLLILLTGLASFLAAAYAFVPAALAITVAEFYALHAATYYAGAGLLGAVAAWMILLRRSFFGNPGLALTPGYAPIWLIVGTAGVIGGLIYWRIAGRTAGAWRRPEQARP
jgi:hypothetical protein